MGKIFVSLNVTILMILFSGCDASKSDILFKVVSNKKVGYVNIKGELKIPFAYFYGHDFSDGLAMVVVDTLISPTWNNYFTKKRERSFHKIIKYGFINQNNEFVIPPNYIYKVPIVEENRVNISFSEGLAPFQDSVTGKYGYIDNKRNVVIKCIYEQVHPFKEGLACVGKKSDNSKDKLFGFIDKKGDYVIQPKYSNANSFSNGVSACELTWHDKTVDMIRSETVIINKEGKVVSSPLGMVKIREFREGFAIAWDMLHGSRYIDRNGEYKTETIEAGGAFSEGLAPIRIKSKWGFIDTTFKLILPSIYDDVGLFHSGTAAVKQNGLWGLIDRNGKLIHPYKFTDCEFLHDDIYEVSIKQLGYNIHGLIDIKGKFIWQEETLK